MAKKEEPTVDNTVEKQKIKKKPSMKKIKTDTDGITKVDLTKLKEAADNVEKVDLKEDKVEKTEEVKEDVVLEEVKETPESVEETPENTEKTDTPILEEITDEVIEPEKIETPEELKPTLPEGIEKLVQFMKDTGGDMNDYVKLNKDYSEMDNLTLLKEYYKESKPHLNDEEIGFLMEDQFSYDEENDEDKDIKRKKLALKEQVAGAKKHLDGLKSKYYDEIKMGSKLTKEQQEAIEFFSSYKQNEADNKKVANKQKSDFLSKTENVFNDKFKGFEYSVGNKKYRFNVNNPAEVKDTQGDINNFVKKFLTKDGLISDAKGYHKSLYTAMNADAIAKHFYEQGKADAIQDSVTNAKNIDMSPRQSHGGDINASGMKVKVLGENAADFKFKIKNKK